MARPDDQHPAAGVRRQPAGSLSQHLGDGDGVTDDLLLAAGSGDRGAFAAFYDNTASATFGFLRSMLGESAGAERAAERVYLKMWHAAPGFTPTGRSATSLLMFTARRELVGRLRDIVSQHPAPSSDRDETPPRRDTR